MNTKRLTQLSMLIAVYVVLAILTPIKVANFKFTFEAFPVLVASLLLGPVDGLIVGGVGSFIYQLLFSGYGITATTLLWVLPHAISGYVVGLYAKSKNFEIEFKDVSFIGAISAFIVTGLNIFALYVDSKVFGYYSAALIFANIPIKLITGIILAILYATIIPKLLKLLKTKE